MLFRSTSLLIEIQISLDIFRITPLLLQHIRTFSQVGEATVGREMRFMSILATKRPKLLHFYDHHQLQTSKKVAFMKKTTHQTSENVAFVSLSSIGKRPRKLHLESEPTKNVRNSCNWQATTTSESVAYSVRSCCNL